MAIEDAAVAAYLDSLSSPRDPILQELEAFAGEWGIPIVGPRVGSLLRILSSQARAAKALELGTAIGYSAIWLAGGVAPDGRLITVEAREDMVRRAKTNLTRAGYDEVVKVIHGEALDVITTLGGEFDIIFNDIDKEGYPRVLPACKEALRQGGLLVTDNVLWGGRVADPDDRSSSTVAIREYNRMLASDRDMETVIVPLRDGVSISQKKR